MRQTLVLPIGAIWDRYQCSTVQEGFITCQTNLWQRRDRYGPPNFS